MTTDAEVKDSIRGILDDENVRVKELTYRDLSVDHSTVEIIIVLEQSDDD